MVSIVHFESFGLENLEVTQRELGEPGPGQVRVKVHAVSLNYRDLLMVKGGYNPRLKLPMIPCSDGAGEITAVGEGVDNLAVGDRVCSTMIPDWEGGRPAASIQYTTLGGPVDGLLAEEVILPANAFLKIPDYLDWAQAACLPVAGLTAWSSLVTEAKIGKGSKVLLLGTGGVSIMALGIAKALGAEVVITSGSDEKLARARELGADHTINYKTTPRWDKAVTAVYPEGVDCTLEVGGDGTFDLSVKSTGLGGTIALIGVLAASNKAVNLTAAFMRRLRLQGILVGSRSEFADYLAFLAQSRIEPVISHRFEGLAGAPEAFRLMEAGGHFGKIVIEL
ncbi:MAG: NAD(P)-dependent alcohol dehydrogenase [Acidobacteriota bacterium]|nr:NAD(P)-dependent alcohol dehydrogenase [Acidobacteriota bacterium]